MLLAPVTRAPDQDGSLRVSVLRGERQHVIHRPFTSFNTNMLHFDKPVSPTESSEGVSVSTDAVCLLTARNRPIDQVTGGQMTF